MRKRLIALLAALLVYVPAAAGINSWLTGEYANAGITTYYIGNGESSSLMMSPVPAGALNSQVADGDVIITAASVKLNGVNVGENNCRVWNGGVLDCIFAVTNNSESERTATVAIAAYRENNTLCGFETVNITLEGGESENARIIYDFPENAYRGKIMFWDSLSGMMPLRASIDFSQTTGANAYYYDLDNRLLQVDKSNGNSLIYDYDNMGNLLSKTVREDAGNV